jgi:antitoxin component YwqK of YwqJK toxin-antitoxin module
MKHVYSPSGSLEAHMLVHLLEQSGIKAHIHGEALLGGMGDLPTADLIKIAVADEDYEKARQLILEWEKQQPPDVPIKTEYKSSASSMLMAGLIGAVVGWAVYEHGYVANPHDYEDRNQDGKPDYVLNYKNGKTDIPSGYKQDLNFDGKFDVYTDIDASGQITQERVDYNFDGSFETITTFKNNLPVKSEVDTNDDGKPDMISFFENGISNRTETLDLKTNKVVRIDYYDSAMLKAADFDSDGDGFLETSYKYDRYRQVIETKKNQQVEAPRPVKEN